MSDTKELLAQVTAREGKAWELLQNYLEGLHLSGPCDKCGEPVPDRNNTAVWGFLNSGGWWATVLNVNRHLEPVTNNDGVVTCPGSPSRWQHVSGMPDSRPEYRNEGEQNTIALAIWQMMQEL